MIQNSVRWFVIINLLILVTVLTILIFLYPAMPSKIPTHFALSGQPDEWTGKGLLWVKFAVMASLNVLIFGILLFSPWLRRHPQWVPGGKRLVQLAPEQQGQFWKTCSEMLLLLCQSVNLIFAVQIRGSLFMAMGQKDALGLLPILLVLPLFAITVVWIFRLIRMLKVPLAAKQPKAGNAP